MNPLAAHISGSHSVARSTSGSKAESLSGRDNGFRQDALLAVSRSHSRVSEYCYVSVAGSGRYFYCASGTRCRDDNLPF